MNSKDLNIDLICRLEIILNQHYSQMEEEIKQEISETLDRQQIELIKAGLLTEKQIGMYNGLELAICLIKETEPNFR